MKWLLVPLAGVIIGVAIGIGILLDFYLRNRKLWDERWAQSNEAAEYSRYIIEGFIEGAN